MNIKEILRCVLLSVLSNKFRVFLTSLGIIIGTCTIIMVVGIGKAGQSSVEDQYKRLSVETITITRGRVQMGPGMTSTKTLTKDLALKMPDVLDNVAQVGASVSTSSTIAYGTTSENIGIQGITEDYAAITNLDILEGAFFTDEDGANRSKVAVLGYNVAQALFGEDVSVCVGEKVLIKGTSFIVEGVLQRIGGTGGVSGGGAGNMASSSSPDDMAYIPYDVALKYTSGSLGLRGGPRGGGVTTTFVALADNIKNVKIAIQQIQDYITEVTGDSTSYTVTDAGSTLSAALKTSNTMATLLIAVAAIVLIVSGIGIMNVLMVSVKERTREIGILKSIGASQKVILMEFLFEAMFISIFGGFLGVMISFFAPQLLKLVEISYEASFNGVLLGFGFSVVTGIFFGYYPALRASKLKPIDALNAE